MGQVNILIIFFISACILNIFTNTATVCIVCYSRRLRSVTCHILKVSIALADLIMGCLHLSHYVRQLVSKREQGCYKTMTSELITECLCYFVVGWTMVTFNVMSIVKKNEQVFSKYLNFFTKASLCSKSLPVWQWLVGTSIVVPVVVTSSYQYDLPHVDEVLCMEYLPEPILIMFSFIALHLPCYLNVAYLVTIIACHCRGCYRIQPAPLVEDQGASEASSDDENILWNTVPVVTYIVCLLPLVIYTWVWFIYRRMSPEAVSVSVTVFLVSRTILQPLSWLVSKDIRKEIHGIFMDLTTIVNRLFRHRETSTLASVSYNVLQESQTL